MRLAIISLTLLLGGCASTFDSESPAVDEYTLNTTSNRAESAATAPTSVPIQLMQIEAAPGYDTRRILVTHPDGRVDVLADARWVGSIPRLLEVATLDQLRAAGFDAHPNSAALVSPYSLRITIRRFDAEYATSGDPGRAAAPTARVVLDVTLIRRRDRLPMATWMVSGAAVATENRRAMIVSALGSATSVALTGLVNELSAVTVLKQ
ncbi:MAG: ABC-type transport auxiliary lipoprotein component [Pseudomonadota bacterium]|jgi:ABC-type uncharacterized transport system auxiliary subunit